VEFFFLSLRGFGKVLNSRRDVLNKVTDVVNLSSGVLEEILSVFLNPLLDSAVESVNKRLRANLQPSNIVDQLLSIDVVFNCV